jgi:hypothetical protein
MVLQFAAVKPFFLYLYNYMIMKELLEITQILDKKKISKIEILDTNSLKQPNNLFARMYNGLYKEQFETDEQAAQELYQSPSTDARYRQLKSRFRKRLLNTFFFLDPNLSQLTGRTAALYSCRRNLALVHILRINGVTETALGEAQQIQNMAIRFGFPDMVVSSALIMREIHAGQNDEKNFSRQDKLIEEYEAVRQAEQLSEKYIQFIRLAYQSNEAMRPATLLEINARCDELLQLSEQHSAPLINFNAFEAWMLRFELEGDFTSAADVAEQAEGYLKKQPTHHDDEKLKLFALGRLRAALHSKDFKKGRAFAENAFRLIRPHAPERLRLMEFYLLLSIHTDSVLHAFAVYKDAVEHKQFQHAPETEQEKWSLFTPYMHLLMELRPLQQQFVISQKRKDFKIEEFVASPVPYLSQRENQTILIAIAQIMFFFHIRNLTAAGRQIIWLHKLAQNLTKKGIYPRQCAFINLLHELHKNEYRQPSSKRCDKFLETFNRHPFRYRGQLHELEIIPYEKLWEITLGLAVGAR